ncbi:MAG: AAA-like domain-containing protein [Clostridia bacterium]
MAQKKRFNITGPCIPALHYMVDTSEMIDLIVSDYVDAGEYFTMNRARQYGKTTTLKLLTKQLSDRYIVIDMSFEGKDEYFASLSTLAEGIRRRVLTLLQKSSEALSDIFGKPIDKDFPMSDLGQRITALCDRAGKPVVLLIDEVDKASDNQVFMTFLGVLRDMYIEQASGNDKTFHSVILAGVHDVKNLKMKLRPDEKHSYNSPWNIAARFDVDMSFSAPEIVTMLHEYESDHHTGMDAGKVAQRLFYYTSGYPFLVSLLCKTMDEERLNWTDNGVDEAEKRVLKTNNTLFDDVIKNLVNHPSFGEMMRQMLLGGVSIAYQMRNPDIDLGIMYGIIKDDDGRAAVSNIIFETIIFDYYISVFAAENQGLARITDERSRFIANGKLNMPLVLERFAAFMRCEYRDEDGTFIEREGRLLFLSFLKPIINGTGHYVVEPETRGSRRMDVAVFYGGEEHIVELKIWHGEQAANEAYDQLSGYLLSQEQQEGYLLSFCDNQKSPREGKIFEHNGCRITEVIVAYRDKE